MIFFKIIIIIFTWLSIGVFTQWLMYIRRKLTGLPTNGQFKVMSGTYVAVWNRQDPDENVITGLAVMLLGPISLLVWTIGTFILLICPLITYLIAQLFIYIIYKLFGLEDKTLDLDNFINCDLETSGDDCW